MKSGSDYTGRSTSVLDPMTIIDGCGISLHQFEFFFNFQAIIKIRTDVFVVSVISTLLSNQSVSQYQSFSVTKCQIFFG